MLKFWEESNDKLDFFIENFLEEVILELDILVVSLVT